MATTTLDLDQIKAFTTTVKRIKLRRNVDDMQPFLLYLNQGDSEQSLRNLTVNIKFQTVITSPPYYPQQRSYGATKSRELGQEKTPEEYIDNLTAIFRNIRPFLKEDGSIFIVIDDGVKDGQKLNIPFRLIESLKQVGYYYRDLIIWQKFNSPQGKLNGRLWPVYEYIIFMSKGKKLPLFETDRLKMRRKAYDPMLTNAIYTYHQIDKNSARNDIFEETDYVNLIDHESLLEGVFVSRRDYIIRHKINFEDFQIESIGRNAYLIEKYERIIKNHDKENYPTTEEVAAAFGFDPEKYCPVCYQKYKRHVSRNYNFKQSNKASIFGICMNKGKSFSNLWKLSIGGIVKGRNHEAVFPFSLVYRLIKFASNADDFILDPFCGRGTVGMLAYSMNRNFFGMDLYKQNIDRTRENIRGLMDNEYFIEFFDHEIA